MQIAVGIVFALSFLLLLVQEHWLHSPAPWRYLAWVLAALGCLSACVFWYCAGSVSDLLIP